MSDAPGLQRALTTVIATCYLKGVSTRRMNDLVATLGINNLSKSQVSDMAKDLDAGVDEQGPVEWAKYKALQAENAALKRENEFLGKASAFFATKHL